MDDLGLGKAIDRLGQSVVMAVANTADRRLDGNILRPAVAVVDEAPAMMDGSPVMQRLLQRIKDRADMRFPADAPANDIAGIRT